MALPKHGLAMVIGDPEDDDEKDPPEQDEKGDEAEQHDAASALAAAVHDRDAPKIVEAFKLLAKLTKGDDEEDDDEAPPSSRDMHGMLGDDEGSE
jgi:hypothetical protein